MGGLFEFEQRPVAGLCVDVRAAEVFVAVAEELHFSRAASRVYMTQPAVSRHVTRLEAALGVVLFKRSKRQVELTPEGHAFLGAARSMLAAARRAVEAAQLSSRGGAGLIRVGSAGTYPNELAGVIVRAFCREHSSVEIRLTQSSYVTAPLAGVDRNQVDIAVVRAPVLASGVDFQPLVQEPRLLALSARHRLAKTHSIDLQELEHEGMVSSLHWPQHLRDYWAGVHDGLDASYRTTALANNPGEWLSAIAQGSGISLCPASLASYYTRQDLAYVRVDGLAKNPIGLAWRHDQHGPLMRHFIHTTRAHIQQNPILGWQPHNWPAPPHARRG
jgi:DNA-binding transcriptional LysR family regulator